MLEKFMNSGKKVLIIDNDPDVVRRLRALKISCEYGNLSDYSILEKIDLTKAEVLMSSIADFQDSLYLIKKVREVNKKAIIIVTENHVSHSFELYNAGADYVVIPHIEGEKQVAVLLEDFSKDISRVLSTKLSHIEQLRKRQSMQDSMQSSNGSFFEDIDNIIKSVADRIKESGEMIMNSGRRRKSARKENKDDSTRQAKITEVNDMLLGDGKKAAGQEA
jgi:Trk K+ transport system NAD-binding subunit